MAQAKVMQRVENQVGEYDDDSSSNLRLETAFDMFNRRTEFPFEMQDNPMRIYPQDDEDD